MNTSKVRLATAIVLLCCAHSPSGAQTTFGSITGTVVDQSGATIPGVVVTIVNDGTGVQRSVTTKETGVFNVADLPVGSYRVRVESKGFSGSASGHPGILAATQAE